MAHGGLPERDRQAQDEKHVDRPGKVGLEKVERPAILRNRPEQRYLPVRADVEYDMKPPTAQCQGVAGAPRGKPKREQRKNERHPDQTDERVGKDLRLRGVEKRPLSPD